MEGVNHFHRKPGPRAGFSFLSVAQNNLAHRRPESIGRQGSKAVLAYSPLQPFDLKTLQQRGQQS